jgi:hypothetical protein
MGLADTSNILTTLGDNLDIIDAKALLNYKEYQNGSWEKWFNESDGGGHMFWDASSGLLSFDGPNGDASSSVVWERYSILGGGPGGVISGGTRVGQRDIWAWDGGAPGVGKIRHYCTKGKSDASFGPNDEVMTGVRMAVTLPAASWNATTKTATINVPGMRANMTGADFDVRYTKAAQYPALAMAGLGETDPAPGAGTITFTVAQGGIVPTISLDLAVIIYG